MDFSWKSAILHAIYARVSAATPVACTVNCGLASIIFLLFTILNHFQSAFNTTGLWLPVPRKKIWLLKIENIIKRWVPMNFHWAKKNCYGWFPTISGHRNEKLFFMGIEILGLATWTWFETAAVTRKITNTIVKYWHWHGLLFNTDMTDFGKVSQIEHIYKPRQEFQKMWQKDGKSKLEVC